MASRGRSTLPQLHRTSSTENVTTTTMAKLVMPRTNSRKTPVQQIGVVRMQCSACKFLAYSSSSVPIYLQNGWLLHFGRQNLWDAGHTPPKAPKQHPKHTTSLLSCTMTCPPLSLALENQCQHEKSNLWCVVFWPQPWTHRHIYPSDALSFLSNKQTPF